MAENRWMMWWHQHPVVRPDSRTAIGVGGIHPGQHFGGRSGDDVTNIDGCVRSVHQDNSTRSWTVSGNTYDLVGLTAGAELQRFCRMSADGSSALLGGPPPQNVNR
jgi:hypothetical protein